jgi:serine/threonine-protein kinase
LTITAGGHTHDVTEPPPPPPPPPPPDDVWPAPDDPTVVSQRETVVDEAGPAPVGPPPDRRVGAGMLLGLGAVALVAIGILLAYWLTHRDKHHPATTTVTTATTGPAVVALPKLVGMKEADAVLRLGQLGLQPKEIFKPTAKPTGLVVSQNPTATTQLQPGSKVTLVVDSGAAKVAVPDVAGKSFADAQSALSAAGFTSTKTEVTSSAGAPGTVVDEAPPAGSKLAKGSQVTLSVAKKPATTTPTTTAASTTTPTTTAASTTTPTTTAAAPTPQNATMPDVSGQTESAAVQAMGKVGILASLVFVPSQDPLGTVETQAKAAGTTVPFHSHVQVNLSKGPNATTTAQVPNVVGQTLQQAVSAMNSAHLRLIFLKFPVSSKPQAGKVVQQSPLGGAQAPQNAQVLVYLGAYRVG